MSVISPDLPSIHRRLHDFMQDKETRAELEESGYTKGLHVRLTKIVNGVEALENMGQLKTILNPVVMFYKKRIADSEQAVAKLSLHDQALTSKVTPLFTNTANEQLSNILGRTSTAAKDHKTAIDSYNGMIRLIEYVLTEGTIIQNDPGLDERGMSM